MSEQSVPHDPEQPDTPAAAEAEPAPLLTLREPMPDVVETPEALRAVCEAVAGGTGPVAIDAERASGYRYSSRAYLIQLRREGSGTHLVDPI
ncbi:MAG: ribonuclease D, partial [Actinobacteria bacterium]|nr:ribonuclease D [Actinomycetota bacterium]